MPCSVLVVDDDAAFRELAATTLRSWGFAVVGEAGTIAEALARSAELLPDAVLVDVGLPDGDGFALARRLVSMHWEPRVVLISSDSDSAHASAARRAGAAGFVPKEALAGALLRRLIGGD